MGVNEKTVSKWERGVNAPDISLLLELSEILELDIQELLTGEKIDHTKQSNDELLENNKKAIEGLQYYNKKSKRKIIFIFGIILLLFYLIFSSLFLVNNYNKFKVYSIKSTLDNVGLDGYVVYNRNNTFVAITNIAYFDEFIGTDKELCVTALDVTIYNGKTILYSVGFDNSNSNGNSDNKCLPFDYVLSSKTILAVEEYNEEFSDAFQKIDLENLYLIISYKENDGRYGEIVVPLVVDKTYSNDTFF